MEQNRAPQHDHQRAVLLGVPSPETPPRLVGPDPAQHGARERQDQPERQRSEQKPVGLAQARAVAARLDVLEQVDVPDEPREDAGAVSERDHHHVGGQPEVGVQHRLELPQRVALGGELAGDPQQQEADRHPADGAHAIAPVAQEQTRSGRSPGHEHERLVQRGDRRPAADDHAQQDAAGVDEESQRQGTDARPLHHRAGDQHGQERQRHAQQVGPAGVGEGIHLPVEQLQCGLGQHHSGPEPLLLDAYEGLRRQVEARLALLDIGNLQVPERGELLGDLRRGLRLPESLPRAQPAFALRRHHRDQRQWQHAVRLVPEADVLHQPQQGRVGGAERSGTAVLVDGVGGPFLQEWPTERQVQVTVRAGAGQLQDFCSLVRIDEERPLVRIGEAERGEKPGELDQVVPDADQLALHGAALLGRQLRRQGSQLLELQPPGPQFLEAVAGAATRRHADRLQHLRVVDQEHLVAIGLLWREQHAREPVDRGLARVALAAGVPQQRVARVAVERLGTPVLDHQQRPERLCAGKPRLGRHIPGGAVAAPEAPDHRHRKQSEHRQHAEQENAGGTGHAGGGSDQRGCAGAHDDSGSAVRRRRPGRTRVWTKCTIRPMLITAVATYGTMRPRFSTTASVE